MIDIQKYWLNVPYEVVEIKDNPEIMTDGFMSDFHSHEVNKAILPMGKKTNRRSYKTMPIASVMQIKEATIPIPNKYALGRGGRPEYEPSNDETPFGILVDRYLTAKAEPIYIQHKYGEYFRRVYPNCEFRISENLNHAIAVYHKGLLVGAIMPVDNSIEFRICKAI